MWCFKLPVVIVVLVTPWVTEAIKIQRENSLAPPYTDQAEHLIFWDLTGSAQLGGNYVRLTTDEPDKKGAIWNNFPMLANNWEFQLHFDIHGKGVNLNGDGLAIWYVRDTLLSGPVFGSKDHFSGLGIFIDTFEDQREENVKRHRHPYISAMVNNGTLHYERSEDGVMTQLGGCHIPLRNHEFPTKMAISYINNVLAVYVDYEGLSQWKVCMKSEGVYLPTGYFFGISASTSDVTDNHDVIGITTLNLDTPNTNWMDKSEIIPFAENIIVPERYYKESSEEKDLDEEDEEEEALAKELLQEEVHKQKEKPIPFKEPSHTEKEKPKEPEEDSLSPSTSLFMKFIYASGALIVIAISISTIRKYLERRRERMQKRLF